MSEPFSPDQTQPQGRDRLAPPEDVPRRNLGQILRSYAPILAILGIASTGLILWFLASGENQTPPPPSRAPQAPMLPATQRDNELSPEFRRQVQQGDALRAEEALRQGTSALPTPIFERTPQPPSQAAAPAPPPAPEPPPLPARQVAPQPMPEPLPGPVLQQPQRQVLTPQEAQNLLQAMQRQAELFQLRGYQPAATIFYDIRDQDGSNGSGAAAKPQIPASSIRPEANSNDLNGIQVPPPGTILYARLIGRANSDNPGPIVGEILQGDFLGARIVGQFQTGRDGLIMQFRTMTIPARNGQPPRVVQIEAVAVDTDTLSSSLATSVNRRELERIAFAFGTAFLRGLGQAIGQSGTIVSRGLTGVVVQNPTFNTRQQLLIGAGAAAGAAGEIAQEIYGNRPPTIIVEAGTPFGLLFLGGR
jgi:intracellular multiplication protein IcmE